MFLDVLMPPILSYFISVWKDPLKTGEGRGGVTMGTPHYSTPLSSYWPFFLSNIQLREPASSSCWLEGVPAIFWHHLRQERSFERRFVGTSCISLLWKHFSTLLSCSAQTAAYNLFGRNRCLCMFVCCGKYYSTFNLSTKLFGNTAAASTCFKRPRTNWKLQNKAILVRICHILNWEVFRGGVRRISTLSQVTTQVWLQNSALKIKEG